MKIAMELLLIGLLLLVFVQDMKFRAIHIALPIIISILGLYMFIENGFDKNILLYNTIFLTITLFGLYLYLSVKRQKLINPFNSIGTGDLLFFVAVIPYFSTVNYILYFITGMLFSILMFFIIKLKTKTDLVPLAGFLAFYMILLKGIFYVVDLNFFETKLT